MSKVDSIVSASHLSAIEKLGTRLPDTFTAEDAMREAHLANWNVRKQPLFTAGPDGSPIVVPAKHALVRDNPFNAGRIDVLGTAGDAYQAIQNEEHAALLNALVEESGAHFELAGSVDGGRKVFISMKLPGHINIGGVDPINNSILAINSHDGSMAFTLMATPVRYACGNVLSIPYKGMSNMIRIRHTSGAQKHLLTQAREALDITFNYLDGFQEQAEQLINTTMTQARFEELITREFGAEEGAAAATVTRSERKIEQMQELFAEANTQEGIRNTAWAGFNALTEWVDHYAPTRGDDRENARAEKAILYPSLKARALDLMLQPA
jgi:phage/plasmid-like protein (TIGR03299 family)